MFEDGHNRNDDDDTDNGDDNVTTLSITMTNMVEKTSWPASDSNKLHIHYRTTTVLLIIIITISFLCVFVF